MKRLYAYLSEPLEKQNTEVAGFLRHIIDGITGGNISPELFTTEAWEQISLYIADFQSTLTSYGEVSTVYSIYENHGEDGTNEYHYVIVFDNTRMVFVISLKNGKIAYLEPFL